MTIQKVLLVIMYCIAYAADPILWSKILNLTLKQKEDRKRQRRACYLMLYIIIVFKQWMGFQGFLEVTARLNFLMFAIEIGILFAMYEGTIKVKVALFGAIQAILMTLEGIILFLAGNVLELSLQDMRSFRVNNVILLYFLIAIKALVFEGINLFVKNKRIIPRVRELTPALLALVLSIVPASFVFYNNSINSFPKTLSIIIALQICFEGVIIINFLFVMYKKKRKEIRDKETLEFIKGQLKLYDNIQKNSDQIRSMRHDMKSHLCTSLLLLKKGDIQEAEEYMEKLLPDIMLNDEIYDLENTVLSVIIYQEKLKAEKRNIQVTFNVEVKDFPIPSNDLNTIITNMFNNAIEACEQIPEEKRYIDFETVIEGGMIKIVCRNSASQEPQIDSKGDFLTSKMDKINHGYGIKNIRRTVERNNGELQVRFNKHQFVIKAVFDGWKEFE